MKKLLIIALLSTGCTSGMLLRYSYNKALENLPPCSKVHGINNGYMSDSMIEEWRDGVYVINTNYYKAYYTTEGSIYKTVKTNAK